MGWHLRDDAPVWLTIGNFDGVHLGHQALLANLIRLARQDDTRSVLLSFSPNPKVFFSGDFRRFFWYWRWHWAGEDFVEAGEVFGGKLNWHKISATLLGKMAYF